MEEFKVAEEVAISEVKALIEYHIDDVIDEAQVAKDYKETVKAVMRGTLDISNPDSPVYTLKDPIKYESGTVDKSSITFLTRIKPSSLAAITKGIDLQKDALTVVNRMTAYLIQEPSVPVLDKFSKFDYRVIQQLTGLFQ